MPPKVNMKVMKVVRLQSQLTRCSKAIVPCIARQPAIPVVPTAACVRSFSSSAIFHKKGGKQEKEQARAQAAQTNAIEDDATDFSSLTAGIEQALEKLKNDLSKLRTGGRFNPEVLENLRVKLEKDSKKTIKLGELAQVVPKGGRSVMVLVGENDHVKAVTSAIQASAELNLQPQADAHNSSQLNIAIPPPTKESRDQAIQAAAKAGETANTGMRNARAAMQKKLRAMELKKSVRPDELKKAGKEMEKIAEQGVADVKKLVDAAKKGMEQS